MPKQANITFHKMIYRHRCSSLIQVDHILATNLTSDGFANSDTHLNSDGYGTVNDEIFPSNLVPEVFWSVLTDTPKLKKNSKSNNEFKFHQRFQKISLYKTYGFANEADFEPFPV